MTHLVRLPLLLSMVVPALLSPPAALADGKLVDHDRRGAIIEHTRHSTAEMCEAACGQNNQCRSWVWTISELAGDGAQCSLHATALTPFPAPGRVTGLSPGLARTLEQASDRVPTRREQAALRAVDGSGPH
ncbi:PAN domain-containing protein [Maricaulis sp. CAU 1757]